MTCASSACVDLTGLQMLVERNWRYQEHEQYDRDGRRDGPVPVGKEFRPQGLPDHGGIGAAQQIRNDELTDDRNETQESAGAEAPHAERQRDHEERLPAWAAEVGGGFE